MKKNLIKSTTITFALLCGLMSCSPKKATTYYEQHVTFPEGATLEQKLDMASRLTPSPMQLQWQQLELTAFVHFGVNTFTNREWGDGQEDPNVFNPVNLDTDQWVSTLKEAGFKMVILTAKHHDGFCLWPTATTEHSVASSSWRNGKGDVVADLAQSCKKYGMKLGLYLSPWDRNHPTYGSGDGYNKVYLEQLTELLTNYGRVDEVWFDGANGEGPNGKKQEYDWDSVLSTIRRLQPDAVTAIMGTEVRWVGNESGLGRETEWSSTILPPSALAHAKATEERLGINAQTKDLGSRERIEQVDEMFWYPSEVDVSIRPGWFYHANENPKSLEQLVDIYFQSVGMNSSLLLNIPPNRDGLFDEKDVEQIKALGKYIQAFNDNKISTEEDWVEVVENSATINVDGSKTFDAIMLQEDISKGQKVESFTVEAYSNGSWHQVAEGTTIGYKRILLTDAPVQSDKLRVNLTGTRGPVTHLMFAAYKRPTINADTKVENITNLTAEEEWVIKDMKDSTLTIELLTEADGFWFEPGETNSITNYELRQSDQILIDGEFGNIQNNPITQYIPFPNKTKGQIILRLTDNNGATTTLQKDQIGFYREK